MAVGLSNAEKDRMYCVGKKRWRKRGVLRSWYMGTRGNRKAQSDIESSFLFYPEDLPRLYIAVMEGFVSVPARTS